jgi:multicomponent Na+:H+ antiporter subunit D
MMSNIAPSLIFISSALLVPLLKGKIRNALLILIAAFTFYGVYGLAHGTSMHAHFLGYDLTFLRVDKLSKVFGYIFTLNAFAAFIYAYQLRDGFQHTATLFYVGSALGVVFSGDLITLYIFWELMAISSTFIILSGKSRQAYEAAYRYVLVHLFGGLCLLAGIVLYISQTGTAVFDSMPERNIATYLILIGFLVNVSAPPFSAWLADSYPESSVTGGVILSAYTTKTAVYTLMRGFPGWEILIVVGCVMALYGIIYAVLENDVRRILAYSITNQCGYMVAGIGIGTALALNGAAAHAFAGVIYKALLWMSAGSVLYMTGRRRCTELGGLYKTMPLTLIFGVAGALAISSFPATSGFTSKSLIIEGAIREHLFWPWMVLEIATAGVFLHAGMKFPYFVFFGKDQGLRPGEPPLCMLVAMAFLAFLCILLGVYPAPLYAILPYEPPADFIVYSLPHVTWQLQLLMFSALAFFLLLPFLKGMNTISLDRAWFYRKGGRLFYHAADKGLNGLSNRLDSIVSWWVESLCRKLRDAPHRMAVFLLTPFIGSSEAVGEQEIKSRVYRAISAGASPIGISVMATVLIIFGAILCLLF